MNDMEIFYRVIFFIEIACFCVSVTGTSCVNNIYGEILLEKMLSFEYKNAQILDKMKELGKFDDCSKEHTDRRPLFPLNEALRIEDLEYRGWELVFRATSGNGINVFRAWTEGEDTCDIKPTSMERAKACNYRSSAVSEWSVLNIKMVKFALYARDKEVAYVIFNGQDSDLNNWFSKSRVIASSWSDLTKFHSFNHFSIEGHYDGSRTLERRFFINRFYTGCDNDRGYVVVLDTGNLGNVCPWDRHPSYPQFLYSQINSVDYWNALQFGRADYMAIFIKTA